MPRNYAIGTQAGIRAGRVSIFSVEKFDDRLINRLNCSSVRKAPTFCSQVDHPIGIATKGMASLRLS